MGRAHHQSTAHGGHHGLLPGPTRGLDPSEHGGRRRGDVAPLRPSGQRHRPRMCRCRRHRTGAHRGLQALAGDASGQEGQGTGHDHDPAPSQHHADLLRAHHGMGVRRRPGPPARLLERLPRPRRAPAQVLGRPHGVEVHGRPGARLKPASPAHGRIVGPHRHPCR